MARVRSPEPVDGLGFVPDHGQALSLWSQEPDDVHLEAVHVLVFVDQHEAEAVGQVRAQIFVAQEGAPVEQEVVKIQQGGAPLARGEVPEQRSDGFRMRFAPGVLRRYEIA